MKQPLISLFASALLLAGAAAQAQSAKDIVLDRVTAPVARPAATPASNDAMAISVLVESPDGSLAPKSTNSLFNTGDRFRIKLLASRSAKVSLYNTNPLGQFNPKPVWQGEVKVGQETITPRLRLDGSSGVDHLHVVLEPEQAPQGVVAWISSWLTKEGSEAPKDIRLDSENSATTSYLVNQTGRGLVSTFRIVHRR
jgi:hypothetical protein